MGHRYLRVAAVLALIAVFLGISGIGSAAGWPPVTATMSATSDGTTATFVTLLQNTSSENMGVVELKVDIPDNCTPGATWAGTSGVTNVNPGINDGMSLGWIHKTLRAGTVDGPFVFQCKITGTTAPSSFTWVRFWTTNYNGVAVSNSVTATAAK